MPMQGHHHLTIDVSEQKLANAKLEQPAPRKGVKEELPSPRARPPVPPSSGIDQPLKSSMHSSSNNAKDKRTTRLATRYRIKSADKMNI